MNCMRNVSRPMALAFAISMVLPFTEASATAYAVDWLQLAPTPFGTAPPPSTTYAAPQGLGNVTINYPILPGFVYGRQALTSSPNLQNTSFVSAANPGDTYGWAAHEVLGVTYNNSPVPTVLSQPWTITFTFSSPLPANQQLVLGVFGLGKRTPGVGETAADTRTLVTVQAQPTEYTYLGEYQPAIWGSTLFSSNSSQYTLENALTAPSGSNPNWNSGLALVRIDKPLPGNTLTVRIDQTLGDGFGINVGFIQAVPEPGTWAMFGVGLASMSWLRRRRAVHAGSPACDGTA